MEFSKPNIIGDEVSEGGTKTPAEIFPGKEVLGMVAGTNAKITSVMIDGVRFIPETESGSRILGWGTSIFCNLCGTYGRMGGVHWYKVPTPHEDREFVVCGDCWQGQKYGRSR